MSPLKFHLKSFKSRVLLKDLDETLDGWMRQWDELWWETCSKPCQPVYPLASRDQNSVYRSPRQPPQVPLWNHFSRCHGNRQVAMHAWGVARQREMRALNTVKCMWSGACQIYSQDRPIGIQPLRYNINSAKFIAIRAPHYINKHLFIQPVPDDSENGVYFLPCCLDPKDEDKTCRISEDTERTDINKNEKINPKSKI